MRDGIAHRDLDRLLPAAPGTRAIAWGLYRRVAGQPTLSPHGPVLERFGTHPSFHLVLFTVDETTYEARKLWLLNRAHLVLAFVGRLHGYAMVAEAVADDDCRTGNERLWDDAERPPRPRPISIMTKRGSSRSRSTSRTIARHTSRGSAVRVSSIG